MAKKDCENCAYSEMSDDYDKCDACYDIFQDVFRNWEPPKDVVALESINAKLDKIMEHLGIVGGNV